MLPGVLVAVGAGLRRGRRIGKPDAAETKATDLEAALREAGMFNAFVVAGIGKIADVEAAWKLPDKVGVTVGDDGTITERALVGRLGPLATAGRGPRKTLLAL